MTRNHALLFVACEAAALVALACLALGAVAYLGRSAQQTAGPDAHPAAWSAGVASPTSAMPTLPPRWTATPRPTPATQAAAAPTLPAPATSAGAQPTDVGPASEPAATAPASSISPASPEVQPGTLPPTAPPPTLPGATDLPPPSATHRPAGGAIGQRFVVGGIGVTVMGVARHGDTWPVRVVLDVVIENISADEVPYEFFYFSLLDSDSLSYDAAADAPEPSLQIGSLTPGGQVRGNVAFSIEPEAQGLTLIYNPWIGSQEYQPIQVDLGQ